MVATTTTNPVVDAIQSLASDARVRLAMLMGAKLESGWNAKAVGDNGKSFGPFQIHLPAHPGVTAAQAQDPTFATRYMLPHYQNAVGKVDVALWNTNPARAAALAAYYAERPKVMYPDNRITGAWPAVNAAWTNSPYTGVADEQTDPSMLANSTGLPSVGGMWEEIWKSISWFLYDNTGGLVNKIYFGILIGGGSLTIAVGLYLMLKDARRVTDTASAVIGGYAAVGRAIRPRKVTT